MTLLESLKMDLYRALANIAIIRRMNNLEKIYETAYEAIGFDASPSDYAPDEYGCAESLSKIIQKALPELRFPNLLSTRQLYNYLLNSRSFRLTNDPKPGCIIISVTGTGNGSVKNGHTGVIGKAWIMSNDSRTGTWEANYQISAWKRYYEIKGGMYTHLFTCV